MAEQRHLKNAPIREALIDLKITTSEPCEIDVLKKLGKQLKDTYPGLNEIVSNRLDFPLGEASEKQPTVQREAIGVKLTSADGLKIVQLRQNGFTFNRLQPYGNWEEMRDEARRIWDLFRQVSNAIEVSRVATRFINSLDLPMPVNDLAEYLKAPPQVPPNVPSVMESFFYRTVTFDENTDIHCVLTQALEDPSDNKLPMILDIDVFKTGAFDADSEEIWELLESFRDQKNRVFFGALEEKCVELYE